MTDKETVISLSVIISELEKELAISERKWRALWHEKDVLQQILIRINKQIPSDLLL